MEPGKLKCAFTPARDITRTQTLACCWMRDLYTVTSKTLRGADHDRICWVCGMGFKVYGLQAWRIRLHATRAMARELSGVRRGAMVLVACKGYDCNRHLVCDGQRLFRDVATGDPQIVRYRGSCIRWFTTKPLDCCGVVLDLYEREEK